MTFALATRNEVGLKFSLAASASCTAHALLLTAWFGLAILLAQPHYALHHKYAIEFEFSPSASFLKQNTVLPHPVTAASPIGPAVIKSAKAPHRNRKHFPLPHRTIRHSGGTDYASPPRPATLVKSASLIPSHAMPAMVPSTCDATPCSPVPVSPRATADGAAPVPLANVRFAHAAGEAPTPSRATHYEALPMVEASVPESTASSNTEEQKIRGCCELKHDGIEPYLAEVQRRIKLQWSPPEYRYPRVTVRFRIAQNGAISELEATRGDSDVTQSHIVAALNAVRKAAPFAALPPGTGSSIDIEFSFDYNSKSRRGEMTVPLAQLIPMPAGDTTYGGTPATRPMPDSARQGRWIPISKLATGAFTAVYDSGSIGPAAPIYLPNYGTVYGASEQPTFLPFQIYPSAASFPTPSPGETAAPQHTEIPQARITTPITRKDVDSAPYLLDVQRRIKRRWGPSRTPSAKASVSFRIARDGSVSELRASAIPANTDVKAALDAVSGVAPFRPLPDGFPEYIDVEVPFVL